MALREILRLTPWSVRRRIFEAAEARLLPRLGPQRWERVARVLMPLGSGRVRGRDGGALRVRTPSGAVTARVDPRAAPAALRRRNPDRVARALDEAGVDWFRVPADDPLRTVVAVRESDRAAVLPLLRDLTDTDHGRPRGLAYTDHGRPGGLADTEQVAATAGRRFPDSGDVAPVSTLQQHYAYRTGPAVPGDLDHAAVEPAPLRLARPLRDRDADAFHLPETEPGGPATEFLAAYLPFVSPFELQHRNTRAVAAPRRSGERPVPPDVALPPVA